MYRLREFVPDDFVPFSHWVSSQEDLVRICGGTFSFPLQQTDFEAFFAASGAPTACQRYVFEEEVTKRVVGICCFTRIDRLNDAGHIGFVAVCPDQRGRGIGTRMLTLLIAEGFESLGLHRISLNVMEDNQIARRVYVEKLGFVEEGVQRESVKMDGVYKSTYTMSLLKPEWRRFAEGV